MRRSRSAPSGETLTLDGSEAAPVEMTALLVANAENRLTLEESGLTPGDSLWLIVQSPCPAPIVQRTNVRVQVGETRAERPFATVRATPVAIGERRAEETFAVAKATPPAPDALAVRSGLQLDPGRSIPTPTPTLQASSGDLGTAARVAMPDAEDTAVPTLRPRVVFSAMLLTIAVIAASLAFTEFAVVLRRRLFS